MDDSTLLRYSRQIMLPQIDVAGQQRLGEARVLIIGLGGLGSPAAMYLASAGIGTLVVSDHDTVELSNLQRQILHTTNDIGRKKTESCEQTLHALNPLARVISIDHQLKGDALDQEVAQADVVIDGSDNFATRFALNRACVRNRTPLISGAAIRMEGQVSVFHNDRDDSPCYRCLYNETNEQAERCSETGVLAPVVGVIGCLQAVETIKVILGIGETLRGRLLLFDAMTMEWRTLNLRKDSQCPVCSRR